MFITRISEARSYATEKHHGMTALRLQGHDASPADVLWVGLSLFLPGGGADKAASPAEKIYVVLEGEITVVTQNGEATLGPLDSVLIQANEERTVENRSAHSARMLVISPI